MENNNEELQVFKRIGGATMLKKYRRDHELSMAPEAIVASETIW